MALVGRTNGVVCLNRLFYFASIVFDVLCALVFCVAGTIELIQHSAIQHNTSNAAKKKIFRPNSLSLSRFGLFWFFVHSDRQYAREFMQNHINTVKFIQVAVPVLLLEPSLRSIVNQNTVNVFFFHFCAAQFRLVL